MRSLSMGNKRKTKRKQFVFCSLATMIIECLTLARCERNGQAFGLSKPWSAGCKRNRKMEGG